MSIYEPKRDVEQLVSCCEYKNIKALPHFHRSVELIYILCGAVKAKIDNQFASAKYNDIIFIPSGCTHEVFSTKGTRSITLIIPYCYFAPFEEKGIDLSFILLKDKTKNKAILQHIYSIKERIKKQPTLLMQGLVNVVLGLIVESYVPQSLINKKKYLILDIVNYVEQNYTNQITLEKISADFGYDKFYFSKMFNKLFNCNLKTYINTIRCRKVEENKGDGISNAILNAGFNSLSSYYKFKGEMIKKEQCKEGE